MDVPPESNEELARRLRDSVGSIPEYMYESGYDVFPAHFPMDSGIDAEADREPGGR